MDRRQLLEKIRNEMPENCDEQTMAAFIMMKIAEDRGFSEHYYWGDRETRKKIYRLSINIENLELQNKRKLICVTLSKLFDYIATEMGLDVYYIGGDKVPSKEIMGSPITGTHVFPVVKLKDGRYIKCDIEEDLKNIQTGCHWEHFGTASVEQEGILSTLTSDEIENIMRNINYLGKRKEYTDDYCSRKADKDEEEERSIEEIVDDVFSDKVLIDKAHKTLSIVETYKFYAKVMNIRLKNHTRQNLVTPIGIEYMERVAMMPCWIEKDGTDRLTILAFTYNNEGGEENFSTYIYSRTKRQMISVSLEELKAFEGQGLNIGVRGTFGILKRKLRKIEEGKETKGKTELGEILGLGEDDEERDYY